MHGHHARLHVKHKAAHRSLAEFKRSTFESYLSMPIHEFDQRLGGKRYPCGQFVTRTSPVFTHWRRRFYDGGRKHVPDDISDLLTPLPIAVCDRVEVERLARALSEGFDIVAVVPRRGLTP